MYMSQRDAEMSMIMQHISYDVIAKEFYAFGHDDDDDDGDDDVKVSGMMHLLISGNFESKDHLYKMLENVYHNFTSIHNIAIDLLKDPLLMKSMEVHVIRDLSTCIGCLIIFCKCFSLKRILKEDGITINVSLARLLSDTELYLLKLIKDCTNQKVRDFGMFPGMSLIKRICEVYCEPSTIYCFDQIVISFDLMIEFLDHYLQSLTLYPHYHEISKENRETMAKDIVFLKNFIQLSSTNDKSRCQDLLIVVENVVHQMARFNFLCQMCDNSMVDECGYVWRKYPGPEFSIGVLKVLVLQSAPIMSNELVVEYVKYVQENLLDLLRNKTITMKCIFKSQLWILHEGISFLMHLLISYPLKHNFEQEIPSDIRLEFQDLTKNVGVVVCSCLENPLEIIEMSREILDLIEKVDVIKGKIIKTICCMVLRETEQEPPKKDQLASLTIFLKILKKFMDSEPGSIITWKDHENLVLFIFYLFKNNIRGDNCIGDNEFSQYTIQLDAAVINHEELKEVLISAQVDAFNMSCSLLRRYVKLHWWELYSVTKDRVDMHMRVGILKAFACSNTASLTDELLIAYGECTQDSLIELRRYDAFDPLNDQVDVLHQGISLMVCLLISYTDEQEKLSHIKTVFQELLRSIGYVICSSFNNNVNGGDTEMQKTTTKLSKLVEKMNLIKGETEKLLHQVHINKISLESPKTYQLGSMNLLLENGKELMECESNSIIIWKEKFRVIYENLVSLKSFIASSSSSDDDESQNLCSFIVDAGHVAEYLLNTFYVGACHELWISEFTKHVELLTATVMEVNMKKLNMKETNTVRKDHSQVLAHGFMVPTSTDVVVGFELEIKLIRKRLFADLKLLDVISIIGMPGLGKTTLARKAYEDPSTIEHFDVRAWCLVSQEYNRKDLFLAIIGCLIELTDNIRKLSEKDLSVMVHKQLTGRRYFIVLDDIWDINAFFYLNRYFPDNNNGSRILLTSRSEVIGSEAKVRPDSDLIKPALLTDEQSWDLLERKIYNEGKCPPGLCEIGNEIAKNCNGLPLGIVVVSGVLAKESQNQGFWEEVSRNLCSYIARDHASQFVAALELSYTYLPDCLKPMFLYFGAFPEDNEIPTKKLMRLWIAEGFVQKAESSSLESQAEKNLMDLIDRSLVMVAKRRWDGRVKACHVHDLLHDMCLAKARKEKFMQQVHVHNEILHPVMYQRRLSILLKRNDETTSRHLNAYTDLPQFSITPPIYSLLFFHVGSGHLPWEGIEPVISSLKLLKVFDAEMFEVSGDVLCKYFTMLVHLRYVSFTTSLDSIPSAISWLQRLETLIIKKSSSGYIDVPETIWEMTKLRHLRIEEYGKFSAASESTFILENLETLSTFCTNAGEEEKIFRKLPALKILRFRYEIDGDETQQVQYPDFESLGKLESLTFDLHDKEQKLRKQLKFSLPFTLKKLKLDGLIQLEWSQISMLKTLPNLEVLKLIDSVEEEVWDMEEDDVFTNLKILVLFFLDIKEWSASSVNFPCLEKLVLDFCPKLGKISSELGEIDTLQKIEVIECSSSLEKQVKEIQKEQEEFGNDSLQFYFKGNCDD